jgi:PAS domain S-box-containing protein
MPKTLARLADKEGQLGQLGQVGQVGQVGHSVLWGGCGLVRGRGAGPSGIERTFGADEIIVTKTDTRGRITYANDVFLRVSAYTESEVMGQPHSKVRHPDMPRCVFKVLWDALEARQEVFAYVMNLAGDGAHYWVLAHVTPSLGAGGRVVGYHSNRRAPSKRALEQIRLLYASLLATESRHSRPVDAIAASTSQMAAFLAERGLTYDEYVWSLAEAGAGVTLLRRARPSATPAAVPAVVAQAIAEMSRASRAVAAGDFEARVMDTPGSDEYPELVALRHEMNRTFDRTDAFIREATASLVASAEGRYHREFLLGGTLGSFREGAVVINTCRVAMAGSAAQVTAAATARLRLGDELETTVLAVAEQVATAATELSASASSLSASAMAAVEEADSAKETGHSLETSSAEIEQVVTLISRVADKTRLLALNATIESARAGEAGRGFSVVASEVKSLADQTSQAAKDIVRQIGSVQSAAGQSTAVMDSVAERIRAMNDMVEGINVAVHGDAGVNAYGLSQMAEMLRAEVVQFLAVLRAS